MLFLYVRPSSSETSIVPNPIVLLLFLSRTKKRDNSITSLWLDTIIVFFNSTVAVITLPENSLKLILETNPSEFDYKIEICSSCFLLNSCWLSEKYWLNCI